VLVPAFAHPILKHRLEYENFLIYSDQKLQDTIKDILKETKFRIENLEIYDPAFKPDIFICESEDLYKFFAFWARLNPNSQGFNLSFFGNTFLNMTRINSLKYYHDQRLKHTHLNGNISQVLAHELIHNLDSRYSGFWNYIEKPVWKKEGYCEFGSTIAFISMDETYDLYKRSSFYFEDDLFNVPNHSKFYYKAQIMVEYLFTEKGFTFEMLSDSSVTDDRTYEMLKEWYYETKGEMNAGGPKLYLRSSGGSIRVEAL
jgi:hypothetical protein